MREQPHVDRPEEVRVEQEHGAEQRRYDLLGALRVTQTVRLERVTHDDVTLYRHRDDQPHAEVARRVADDVRQLAQPVGRVANVVVRQLADPQPQQPDVQHERVGQSEDHQVEVGRELEHRLALEDDEREDVSERAEQDEYRRNVEQQRLVQLELGVFRQLLLVTLSNKTCMRYLNKCNNNNGCIYQAPVSV